jgi:hypothetical protein
MLNLLEAEIDIAFNLEQVRHEIELILGELSALELLKIIN